ncbi:MAG: hypothetical protein IKZ82_10020 [Clostridia bacterium]|nr:hypothetical protein [Clostridia bacterium]
MKRFTLPLSRTVLVLLLLFLFSAIACHSVPHEYVSSYADLQKAFAEKNGVVFPDLSAFNFDQSSVSYRLTHANANHATPVHEYTVYGDGNLNETKIYFTLSCLEGIFECANREGLFTYNNAKMLHVSSDQGTARYEGYHVYINGYEYAISAMFDEGKLLSDEALAELRSEVNSVLYSFACGIVDEAQQNV